VEQILDANFPVGFAFCFLCGMVYSNFYGKYQVPGTWPLYFILSMTCCLVAHGYGVIACSCNWNLAWGFRLDLLERQKVDACCL